VEPIVADGKQCTIEVTIGTAALNGATRPEDVLRLADERMYLAKRRAGSDPFDRVSELIVGLLDPNEDGVEGALAAGVAAVAEAETVYVEHPGGEQWWPAKPNTDAAELLQALAGDAADADELLERGAWWLGVPLRGDGAPIGAFALARSHPFTKADRIALSRAGVALGQALVRLREGDATRRRIGELEYLAFCDENTGLANRRALLAELERHFDESSSLALLFIDFDGLRAVNNELSYEHGNDLLRAVAARIEQTLRPGELAARLHGSGGDEFIVIAPGVDARAAPERAQDLEQLLADVELEPAVAALYGGASVGYALRNPAEPPLDLVERAATLMRNRKRLRKREVSAGN
jgi:diguanylate cyclase (GGDEF)-like protein